MIKVFLIAGLFIFTFACVAQDTEKKIPRLFGKEECESILKKTLGDSSYSAYLEIFESDKKLAISTPKKALKIAIASLYEKYEKKNIKKQKPYEIHLINGIWFIKGTLDERSAGGTFYVFLDGQSKDIIKIFHTR